MRSGHFIVRQTQYKVILSPNPTEKGAVDLLTPDGVRLRSTILGVAVVDPASGASALLAEVKQSRPQWISPNQVIYPDAFDDVKADIRYTVGPDQFEQDLILRQQIPPEIILAAGLDPETARVAVLTEFFDPPSTPAHPRNTPARKRANGDEDIVFGAMTIGQSHCQWASSSNGVFQTVGAGGFYLAKEEWRNAGTPSIDPVLAKELRNTTTLPPIVLGGLVTSDVRLDPQAARDIDLPDLGYHYVPIDYAVGTLVVTNNGSLTFGPGVAVAALGNHGLRIENHGTIRAEGLPAAHGVARTPPRQSSTSNRSIVTRQPKPTSIPTPGTLTSSTPVRSSFTTPTPVPAPKPAPALHRGPAPALRSSIAPPLCCRIVHGIMPPAQQTCTCSSKTSSRMPPSKPQSARPTQDGSNIIKHSSGPAQPRKSIRSKHGHGRTSTPMKCSEKPSSLKCCLLTANG